MMALGNPGLLGTAGHQRFKLLDQPVAQVVVVGELREGQRAVPGSNFAVEDGAVALVGCGDEVLGNTLANFLRRCSCGPVAEVILLRRKRHCCGGQKQAQGSDLN